MLYVEPPYGPADRLSLAVIQAARADHQERTALLRQIASVQIVNYSYGSIAMTSSLSVGPCMTTTTSQQTAASALKQLLCMPRDWCELPALSIHVVMDSPERTAYDRE